MIIKELYDREAIKNSVFGSKRSVDYWIANDLNHCKTISSEDLRDKLNIWRDFFITQINEEYEDKYHNSVCIIDYLLFKADLSKVRLTGDGSYKNNRICSLAVNDFAISIRNNQNYKRMNENTYQSISLSKLTQILDELFNSYGIIFIQMYMPSDIEDLIDYMMFEKSISMDIDIDYDD